MAYLFGDFTHSGNEKFAVIDLVTKEYIDLGISIIESITWSTYGASIQENADVSKLMLCGGYGRRERIVVDLSLNTYAVYSNNWSGGGRLFYNKDGDFFYTVESTQITKFSWGSSSASYWSFSNAQRHFNSFFLYPEQNGIGLLLRNNYNAHSITECQDYNVTTNTFLTKYPRISSPGYAGDRPHDGSGSIGFMTNYYLNN